nr:hypothetical protein CFP56_63303 [Quercus suber]
MDANGFGQIEIGFETEAATAVASLLMKMIWKIQQKIPKLSESHDEYDRDENGTNGEAEFFFPHTGYDEVVGLCSLLTDSTLLLLSWYSKGKKKIKAVFHQRGCLLSGQPCVCVIFFLTSSIISKVNGCGCYIEAERCKLLPELGSAEVWVSSHNSIIILRVQANRRTEVVVVIGVAGMDWTHRKHCH